MLKKYEMPNGHIYQYEEGEQPESAVEVKAEEPKENKAEKPKKNKARKPKGTK